MTIELNTGEADSLASGTLTLRDYFAAQVSETDPPHWFKHVAAPDRPQQPNGYSQIESPSAIPEGTEAYQEWLTRRDAYERSDENCERWAAYERANEAYHALDRMSRFAQWRYAVADAMLAERAKGGAS
jgi:hypothetical protein